jgi:hypothetical protein
MSRKALCGGGKPLNRTAQARLSPTLREQREEHWVADEGRNLRTENVQEAERQLAGQGEKELCSGSNHKGMKPDSQKEIGGRSNG